MKEVIGGRQTRRVLDGGRRDSGASDSAAASGGTPFGRYQWIAAQATREAQDWWDQATGETFVNQTFVRRAEAVERDFPYALGEGLGGREAPHGAAAPDAAAQVDAAHVGADPSARD